MLEKDESIRVNKVSKTFFSRNKENHESKRFEALTNISFSIKKGESVGIIGPNGSGKSTLLQILAGVTKPTTGNIQIRGGVASILDIGAGFHPELSGRENVFLNGQIHGFSQKEIEAKFDEIVAFSEIEKFIDEPVKNYSNGMYLRLAFSIIAHLEFDIYLFDEVLSVGDESFREKVRYFIQHTLKKKKSTFILVSHNFNEIDAYCSRTFLLEEGKLKKIGESREIIRALKHSFQENRKEILNASDEYISCMKVTICQQDKPVQTIFQNESFEIKISITKSEEIPIRFGLRVRDVLGNVVFVTSYSKQQSVKLENKSEVEFSTTLPANYFNKGTFYFDILGIEPYQQEILFLELDVAEINIELVKNEDTYWLEKIIGPVQPQLTWKINDL